MKTVLNKINAANSNLKSLITTTFLGLGLFALAGSAEAGGQVATIFDSLATNTDAAVFGPLGQTIIAGGAAAGGIFAIIKGAWMLAGLGIAVAALMFGAQLVANSAGFGALI